MTGHRLKNRCILLMIWALLWILPADGFPITLSEGLEIIAQKGRDITEARFETEQAVGTARMARGGLLPRIEAHAGKTWLRHQPEAVFGPASVPVADRESVSYGFTFYQPLFSFGRLYNGWKAAEEAAGAAGLNAEETRNRAALEFINAYFDVLEAEKLAIVADKDVERLQSHYDNTAAMLEEGLVTRNSLLQAEVALADAERRRIDARHALEVALSRLNSLLLMDLGHQTDVDDVPLHPSTDLTLSEATAYAMTRRPLLKMIDLQIRAKELELKSLYGEMLPTVYAAGGYTYEENTYMVHEDNWSIFAGARWDLFSGGTTAAKIFRTKAEISALKARKEKVADEIRLAVKKAFLDMESAREKIGVARRSVASAEENLRINRLRYSEGVGTATDVLDAVTMLTSAETNHTRAVYAYNRAEAAFLYTAGMNLYQAYGEENRNEGRSGE